MRVAIRSGMNGINMDAPSLANPDTSPSFSLLTEVSPTKKMKLSSGRRL